MGTSSPEQRPTLLSGRQSSEEPLGRQSSEEPPGRQSSEEPPGRQSSEEPPGRQSSEEPPGRQSSEEPPGRQSSEEPPSSVGSGDVRLSAPSSREQSVGSSDVQDSDTIQSHLVTRALDTCDKVSEDKQLSGTSVQDKQLSGTSVQDKQLSGTSVQDKQLSGTSVQDKQLSGTSVQDKQLSGTSVQDKQLSGTSVQDKQLSGTSVQDKQLSGTSVEQLDNKQQSVANTPETSEDKSSHIKHLSDKNETTDSSAVQECMDSTRIKTVVNSNIEAKTPGCTTTEKVPAVDRLDTGVSADKCSIVKPTSTGDSEVTEPVDEPTETSGAIKRQDHRISDRTSRSEYETASLDSGASGEPSSSTMWKEKTEESSVKTGDNNREQQKLREESGGDKSTSGSLEKSSKDQDVKSADVKMQRLHRAERGSQSTDDLSVASSKSSRRKKRNKKSKLVLELLRDVEPLLDQESLDAELQLHMDYGLGPEVATMTFKEADIPEVVVTEVIDPSFFWIQPKSSDLEDMSDILG